jgi:hypothetical protein
VTENRDVFRRANVELDASAAEIGLSGPRPYLCECDDARCTRTMLLDGSAFEEVRAVAGRYVVLPGHEGELDVVRDGGGYVVVERRH